MSWQHCFRENGTIKLLTKGDNNEVDDRGLYKPGQLWVERRHVVGRARGFVPFVGMVTILMNDYPKLKVIIVKVYKYQPSDHGDSLTELILLPYG